MTLEEKYRRLLWLGHGHTGAALYGDDGEMQCHLCRIWDYRRTSLEKLEKQIFDLKLDQLAQSKLNEDWFTPEELRALNDWIQHEFLPYDNELLHQAVKKLGKLVEKADGTNVAK